MQRSKSIKSTLPPSAILCYLPSIIFFTGFLPGAASKPLTASKVSAAARRIPPYRKRVSDDMSRPACRR
jgi:hypothetical protein